MSFLFSIIVAVGGCALLLVCTNKSSEQSRHVIAALLRSDKDRESCGLSHAFFRAPEPSSAKRKWAWTIGALACVSLQLYFWSASPVATVVAAITGISAGELWFSRRGALSHKRRLRSLEFFLPIVLERVVMGVGSGLDIIPALQEACQDANDPASQLLRGVVEMSERGSSVEEAFNTAASHAELTSVKHACIHLGLAHRQGGEIIRPLKELSDATQAAYQEAVEEQIARLPVEAVLPLVVTFTGLIVCFLSVPLMQVSSMTKAVIHETR